MKRYLAVGALSGAALYALALLAHGGVRAERGCVVDSPIYEIVNGPTLLLADLGLPVSPEGIGESPPVDWVPPPRPPFRASVIYAAGLVGWSALGALLTALAYVATKRLRASGRPDYDGSA